MRTSFQLILKRLRSGYLFDMAIPIFIFEWWNVLLAFVLIVYLETYIVSKFIRADFKRIVTSLFEANAYSTLAGYLLQAIARLIIGVLVSVGYILSGNVFNSERLSPVLQGIIGGAMEKTNHDMDVFAISSIITGVLFTFVISLIIERKVLIRYFGKDQEIKDIRRGILVANIVSYVLLTGWLIMMQYIFI